MLINGLTFGDILVTIVRYEQRCAKVRQQPE